MKIETNRLELVACDFQSFKQYSAEYTMRPHVELYLDKLAENPGEKGWGVWFMVLKDDGLAIGDIGFKGSPDRENKVEIGYGVSPEYQGNGYASEAAEAILKWALKNTAVEHIIAECASDNKASIRVLEKVGFQRCGLEGKMLKWAVTNADFMER